MLVSTIDITSLKQRSVVSDEIRLWYYSIRLLALASCDGRMENKFIPICKFVQIYKKHRTQTNVCCRRVT